MTQFRDANSSRRNSVTQIPADIFTNQFTTSKNCEFLEQSHLGNCFAAESFRELFHCRVLSVIVLLQSHLGNCFTAESSRSSFCCRVISGTVLLQSPLWNHFAAKSSREPFHCRVLSGTVRFDKKQCVYDFAIKRLRRRENALQQNCFRQWCPNGSGRWAVAPSVG